MESEQATPVDSIKDIIRSSVSVPEFDKHLKKAGGHIGLNVVEITIKMKIIARKPLMIKKQYYPQIHYLTKHMKKQKELTSLIHELKKFTKIIKANHN